jgi:1-acyl-sn-glycerol-3-phosphate acyltransferase
VSGLGAWLAACRAVARYHRFEVDGFAHLQRGPALVAGSHGNGPATGLFLLMAMVHDRLGYLPHGFAHRTFFEVPVVRDGARALGLLPGDGPEAADAIGRGEHLITAPGGGLEGTRPIWEHHTVSWGRSRGYVRLALRLGVPIVPVGTWGQDFMWLGLNHGMIWARRLGIPGEIPPWLAVGVGGLFPFAPPFPVKLRQRVGAPIDPRVHGVDDPDDDAGVERVHRLVERTVQDLVRSARHTPGERWPG